MTLFPLGSKWYACGYGVLCFNIRQVSSTLSRLMVTKRATMITTKKKHRRKDKNKFEAGIVTVMTRCWPKISDEATIQYYYGMSQCVEEGTKF